MSHNPDSTPPPNLTSLRARLRNRARNIHELETRVQRRLAALVINELFLAVDVGISGPPVLVKGGTAIDLRRSPSPSRVSKDWDAVEAAGQWLQNFIVLIDSQS